MGKKIWKTIYLKTIVIGALAGLTVAGSAVAFYQLLGSKQSKVKSYNFETTNIFDDKNNSSPIMKIASIEPGGNDYFLNETEINTLKKKIKNDLGYGPEIFKLKEIILGDNNFISPNENGVYFPIISRMYINLDNIQENIELLKDYFINKPDEESAYKINYIFEIIYHEYGHHIAASYLTNEKYNSSTITNSVYINGKLSNWNKYFVTKFKEYLNYSGWRAKKYDPLPIYTHKQNSNSLDYDKYFSIGSIYSQQDLFNYANGMKKYDYPELKNPNHKYEFIGHDFEVYSLADPDKLNYLFSMDELFTRKYQQLSQIYYPFSKEKNIVNGYAKYAGEHVLSLSSLFSDSILYQNGLGKVQLINGTKNEYHLTKTNIPTNQDASTSNRFLYDAPFGNEKYNFTDKNGRKIKVTSHPEDLYKLMDGFMGHTTPDENSLTGADISIVWPKKSFNFSSGGRIYFNDSLQINNEFKFGGFIPNSNYLSIGYVDKNKKDTTNKYGFVKLSDISVKNYTYKHKDWLGSTQLVDFKNGFQNTFYATKNFINRSDLLGKELWFKKTDGTIEKLNSVRDSIDTGTNNTHDQELQEIINRSFETFGFKRINGGVKFTKETS